MDREVYCILGVPVDAIGVPETLSFVARAVQERRRCVLSTVNLNFLALARRFPDFHLSLLDSDLCTADGVGVMTLARLNGVSLPERVTGADLLALLRDHPLLPDRRLKLFIFGGQEGIAELACRKLDDGAGTACVGYRFPGFGDIEEMSDAATIAAINASGADAVIVSLGARKGQAWIMANRHRLEAPVVTHLGAAINFVAGTVKRAPRPVQQLGLEWAWRIWAEPQLWTRYAGDAALVGRAVSGTMPQRMRRRASAEAFHVSVERLAGETCLRLAGRCDAATVGEARVVLRQVLASGGAVRLEFAESATPDCRFLGLVQMFDRELRLQHRQLKVSAEAAAPRIHFRLHGAEYLLAKGESVKELASKKSM